MELSQIIIRNMKPGEEKQVLKVEKNAFRSIESLFTGKPKSAMVAEYDGKIIGGMIFKIISAADKTVAYIDGAFVDYPYQGLGIGQILYKQTIQYLQNQKFDAITAMVKDDNVRSWKLIEDNGLKKVSITQIIECIGVSGLIKHYLKTPFSVAVGMDFYMLTKNSNSEVKSKSPLQLCRFFLSNILLLLPLWIRLCVKNPRELSVSFLAYLTLILLFVGCRYIGNLLNGNKWKFRLNNGGAFLPLILSCFGYAFLINGNWYPKNYENTLDFRKRLAIPEIIKWFVFMLVALLGLLQNTYCYKLGIMVCIYLIFMIIPVYPFDSLGAGRIYKYNKGIWLVTFLITIMELIVLFKFVY